MIDLHLHVLPGIDDGAADLDEAREMCRLAAEDGCEQLILTPHQRHDRWENGDPQLLGGLLAEVQAAVGDLIRLHLGAEIRVDLDLLDDLERRPEGGVTPLAGSRYLLLELPRIGSQLDVLSLAHELRVAGWYPVFAHPEHIDRFAGDLELVRQLVALGALFQLTATSVTGELGRDRADYCRTLLADGLAHFVASDAHGSDWRPPGLSRAARWIEDRHGSELAWRVTTANPTAVLADRPLAGGQGS